MKALALLLLATALAAGFPRDAHAETVLVKGKGFQVTQDDLDQAFVNLRASLAAQGKEVPEAQRAVIERQLMEKLALTQILLGKATPVDREKGKERATKVINTEKERAKSPARFEAQIRSLGMAPDDFEKQLIERGICEEVLDRELRPKLGVTPEKVRAFYDQNTERFKVPERLRLRQVVLALTGPNGSPLGEAARAEKTALASRLVERARKGEDLAGLARQFSDDPGGRDRGGEYVFPVGRMLPEFEAVATRLKTNEISDVVTTATSLHVIQLVERMASDQTAYEKVSDDIRRALEADALQAMLPEYQKTLFAEAGVEFTKP